jgi:hypothetical protein
METINDIVRKVAEEMLNTSMQDITAEIIYGWAVRLGDAATCKDSLQVGNAAKTREALEGLMPIVRIYLSKKPAPEIMTWDKKDVRKGGSIDKVVIIKPKEAYEKAEAALSTPARNCDLYKTESEAYQAYLTAMKNATEKTYVYFEPWLFDEVKGETK